MTPKTFPTGPARRSLRASVAMLSLLAIPSSLCAQATATAGWSVTDAQRRAVLRAPEVVLAVSRADAARADIAVAGMLPNPRVTVGTTSSTATVYGNFFVALPLFGQRGAAIEAADAQARLVAAGVDVARLDARLGATLAWIALWQLDAERAIAEDNAARRERLLETTRVRFAEGGAPRLDILRADTEARRARAELAALSEQRGAAATRLLVWMGEAPDPACPLRGEPPLGSAVPPESALDAAVATHPLTRRARALLQASDAAVERERRARWPTLGLQLGGNFFERQPPPTNDLNVSVSVELPVFSGPLTTRAEANRHAAHVELDTVVVQLRARILAARADYLAAVRRQEAQVTEVLPAAQEAAELALEAYQSGGLDLTGTLDAEQALADARLSAARLTAERARAFATLEHAIGRMP